VFAVVEISAIILAGYLLGSIPVGFIIAKLAGVDIRKVGSGNIGATNVLRTLGKHYGYPVFLLDFLKGLGAVKLSILINHLAGSEPGRAEMAGVIGGIFSVIGHSYPVWLGFKGGKGVATSGGVVFGLMPLAALIGGGVWIGMFLATGYVSLSSIIAALSVPVSLAVMWSIGYVHGPILLLYFSLGIAAIVIIRHRSNLSRLRKGTEARFRRK